MPDKQTKINEMYLEMLDGPECPAQTFLREYLEKKENRPDFTGIKLINQKKNEVEK